jgi:hypothetical protein
MEGYQIIEIDELDDLLNYDRKMFITILLLVINSIKNKYENQIEIKIIKVTYVSSYPSIGVKYLNENFQDLEDDIINEFKKILHNSNLSVFLSFFNENFDEINKLEKETS